MNAQTGRKIELRPRYKSYCSGSTRVKLSALRDNPTLFPHIHYHILYFLSLSLSLVFCLNSLPFSPCARNVVFIPNEWLQFPSPRIRSCVFSIFTSFAHTLLPRNNSRLISFPFLFPLHSCLFFRQSHNPHMEAIKRLYLFLNIGYRSIYAENLQSSVLSQFMFFFLHQKVNSSISYSRGRCR